MRQTIALVAVGNLGKYIYEELNLDDRFDVVVISRQVTLPDSPPLAFSAGSDLPT